jgi:hypothetical protein
MIETFIFVAGNERSRRHFLSTEQACLYQTANFGVPLRNDCGTYEHKTADWFFLHVDCFLQTLLDERKSHCGKTQELLSTPG